MAVQHRIFIKRNNKNVKKRKTTLSLSPVYLQIPPTILRKTKKITRYKKAPLSGYRVNLQKKLTKRVVKKSQPKVKPRTKAYIGKTLADRKFKTKRFIYKGKRYNKLRFFGLRGKRNNFNRSLSFLKRAPRTISVRKKFVVWVRFANKVQKVRRYSSRKRIVRLLCKKTYFRKKLPKKPKKLYFLKSVLYKKRQIFRVRRRTIVNVDRIKKPIDKIGEMALALKRKILLEYTSVEGSRWYMEERNALWGQDAAPVKPIIAAAPVKPIIAAVPVKPVPFKAWIEPAI